MKSKPLNLNSLHAFCLMATLALAAAISFIGCSDSTSGNTAGIIIETNTGNKGSARVYVPTELWDLSTGDTVSLEQIHRDTIGDTIFVHENDYRKVADSTSIASGLLLLDSVPEGRYDSVTVYTSDGKTQVFTTNIDIDKEQTYYLDSAGDRELAIEELSGTIGLSDISYLSVKDFSIKAGDSLTFYGHTIWGVANDTLVIYNFEEVGTGWSLVMNSKNVATGLACLSTISYGFYDSLVVKSPDGSVHKYPMDFYIDEGKSYYIHSNGATPITVESNPKSEGNAQFYFSVKSFEMTVGDTLFMIGRDDKRVLSNDTIYVATYFVEKIIDSSDVAAGTIKIENVPEGIYNDLDIYKHNANEISHGWAEDYKQWTLSKTPIFISKDSISTDSSTIKLIEQRLSERTATSQQTEKNSTADQ